MRFLRLQSTAFDCNRLHSIPRPLRSALLLTLLLLLLPPPSLSAPHPTRQQLLEQLQQQQAARTGAPAPTPPASTPSPSPSASPVTRHSSPVTPVGTEIGADEVPRDTLLPADLSWLDASGHAWHHLRTAHFVIHYEKKIFASKVARLAESFYGYISADLPPDLPDRLGDRLSHIFVFADARDWPAVLAGTPGLTPLTVSFVRNQAMYLQEWGDNSSDKMSVLAHEMTHLVINRFLKKPIPLWLNEGLAEYYGEFAYRAVRGMGQSKSSAFPATKNLLPLQTLLALTTYPPDTVVLTYYRTAKYLVGFLRLKHAPACWNAYLAAVATGTPSTPALLSAFPYPDLPTLETAFGKFAH